ncbi:vacuolar protein-sorting-associated protein 4 [Babesia microti strain RI]|uniref:Vacuolar protein-sorting-associated protein 4 n=1 Tax=Babesia microti (strain RI) TaxID=1133968 RepID=I7J8X2_BABMR|nr:vacuolar protein-sorting-associated protein 4 [Babesia microti strain RI]CCF75628.2 vacuolar protein-sorting-associated protein 4 [Babesia microti strain RI]|eukprot:XP_021337191.1 vacuolar protein-sorting-associated protein 4 [Babesia microti strain RI]
MDALVSAVKFAQEAALESNAGNSGSAIELYKKAIGILQDSYKNENDEHMKRKIFNQMKIYLEKAESIKEISDNSTVKHNKFGVSKSPQTNNFASQSTNITVSPKESTVKWSDVAGLDNAKEIMEEAILLPLKFPNIFKGKIRPWKSILLYGPPGTGKTLIAQACAYECNIPFFSISSADIMSKWQGESEKFVKNLFKNTPDQCIIFIDEIDSICGERNETDSESSKRVKTELLIQMQDLFNSEKQTIVIAATNLPWTLDSAVRRRFEKRIYIPLPNKITRKQILQMNLSDLPNNLSDADLDDIARLTDGFNAADVGILVRTGIMYSLKVCRDSTHFKLLPNGSYTPCAQTDPSAIKITFNCIPTNKLSLPAMDKSALMQALDVVSSSVDPQMLGRYEQWTQQFGQ